MLKSVIVEQNPHWEGKLYSSGIPRDVLVQVQKYLDLHHILSVVGVRRSGKSTLLKQIINDLMSEKNVAPHNILFLNLEQPVLAAYRHDVSYLEKLYHDYLKLANPQGKIYCFLDEVHFFPEWQVFVKSHYEQHNVKFIVTSSNSHLLSSEFITLLSGRTLPLEVYPFSFSEFLRAHDYDIKDPITLIRNKDHCRRLLDEYLHFGGFPEITFFDDETVKKDVLSMYARNILYRDIVPRFEIKKSEELENLFFYLISNIGSLYTCHALSKFTQLSDKTIKQYLSFFENAYLLYTVNAFHFSLKQQIQSAKKIYTIDVGLANVIGFNFSENWGHFLENLVFLELKRQKLEVFYYQTAHHLEVDFVCRQKRKVILLIQVAKEIQNPKTRERELKALMEAMAEKQLKRALIITYEDEEQIKIEDKIIDVIPAYRFLTDAKEIVNSFVR